MRTVSVNGLRIAYASAGAGSPRVCLVHGTGGSSGVWAHQLDGLADCAHIVAVDLPGHGRSGGHIPKRIEDAAAVVADFLDALGIGRVVIGGHSMGGAIAQQFALTYPDRVDGVILIGTGARLRVLPRLLDLLAIDCTKGVDLLMSLAVGPQASSGLRTALHRSTADNPPGVVLGDLQACDAFDVMSRVATISVPALVMCGEDDQLTPPLDGFAAKAKVLYPEVVDGSEEDGGVPSRPRANEGVWGKRYGSPNIRSLRWR